MKNVHRIQTFDSIMCEYFCISFIDFMWNGKILLEYTNLFSPNEYKRNDKIILNIFNNYKDEKNIALFAVSIENLKSQKYHTP